MNTTITTTAQKALRTAAALFRAGHLHNTADLHRAIRMGASARAGFYAFRALRLLVCGTREPADLSGKLTQLSPTQIGDLCASAIPLVEDVP